MINSQQTKQTFRKLMVDDNRSCFECDTLSPTWASLPYGIFLCYNCSGIHRGMGVHISFVRSVDMDTWQEKQLNMMLLGGNRALRDFFNEHDISIQDPNKYKTNAAYYYREKMKAIVNESEMPPIPQDWKQIYEQPQFKLTNQAPPTVGNKVQRVLHQGSELALGTIHQIDEQFNQTSFAKEVKDLGTGIQNKSKELGASTSKIVQKSFTSVKQGLEDVWSFVKSKVDKSEQKPQVEQPQIEQPQPQTHPQQEFQVQQQQVSFDFLNVINQEQKQKQAENPQPHQSQQNYAEYFLDEQPTSEILIVQQPVGMNLMEFEEPSIAKTQIQSQSHNMNHDLLEL